MALSIPIFPVDQYSYLGTLYYLISVYLRGIGALFIFFCIILYTHHKNAYHDLILFCRDRILSFHSFYCCDRKFLCRDRDSAFISLLCRNMSFFVAILFVLLFNSLLRQRIHLLHVLFVMTEIIFVVTEILLLLVVNSQCYVATGFSLLQHKFLLSWLGSENFVAT